MFTDTLKLIWLLKSLSSGVPHILIEKMESFFRSLCIASPCGDPLWLWQAMGYLEEGIYTQRYILPIWNEIVGIGKFQPDWNVNDIIYVLPADHPLPTSWLSITVPPEKSATIAQLLDSLESCPQKGRNCRGILVKDFRKGTYRSVFGMPSKENDLYALKRLVNERRQEMGLEPFPCTPPTPRADLCDILDGVVLANLFHEPLPDPGSCLVEVSNLFARADVSPLDEEDEGGESVYYDSDTDDDDSGVLPEDSMAGASATSDEANDNTSERCSSVPLDDVVARLSEEEAEVKADREYDDINEHELTNTRFDEDEQRDSNVVGFIFGLVLPVFLALCFAIIDLYASLTRYCTCYCAC
ncbi:hypothetical protein VNI00_015862 [Paramarasmius palmivorus]|uniref:Uncharacterized protein n=1 Tax=Paramarasmius palmivorus TaxID=297713 RepID=A0AAW0BIH2_9AGAR